MGFTHYFTVASKVSKANRVAFINAVEDIIRVSGIPICNECGDVGTKPTITADRIMFNGEGDDSHETFSVPFKDGGWDFCKTARKPYDKVVVACLLIGMQLGVITKFTSDGSDSHTDFDEAKELLKKYFDMFPADMQHKFEGVLNNVPK